MVASADDKSRHVRVQVGIAARKQTILEERVLFVFGMQYTLKYVSVSDD